MFESAVKKAVENTKAAQSQKAQIKTDTNGDADFSLKNNHITADMSDTDRTKILSAKSVVAPIYEGQADESIENNLADLNSGKISLVKNAIVTISEQFGIIGEDIQIEDVDVEIRLSKSNLRESVSKKVTPTEFAKLIPVLKDAVSNAIGIERHDNRYYYDTSTVYFENLLGGFVDGEYFVPVRFGLKHSKNGQTTLYVVVDQDQIPIKSLEQTKKTEVVKTPAPLRKETATSAPRSVKYNVSQIIPFVKSKDLLRYIPDNMLDNEQKKAKWEAIAETIKTTAKKNDKKYKQYISEGKIYEAQKMVETAARVHGYTIVGYHGSDHFFTTFGKGNKTSAAPDGAHFFTDNKDVAYSYTAYKKNVDLNINSYPSYKQATPDGRVEENKVAHGGVYPVYLKIQNPYIVDFEGKSWGNKINGMDINEIATWAKDNGYDGVIAKNIIDAGDLGDANYEVGLTRHPSTDYIVFNSARAKSSETITYDSDDNIIPISERFDEKNKDIRYSLKGTNNISTKDRKELLDIIEHLKGEFEVTKFAKADPKKLAKMTKDLLKEYSSKADYDETFKAIDELYQYMANGEDGNTAVWDEVYNRAYNVAQNIIENSLVVDDELYQHYKSLRDYLRSTPIKFNPQYDSVPSSYENFNEFRKMNMGRLKFANNGRGIDSVYQELAGLYPEFFNEEEQNNSADQLEKIIDVLDEIQPNLTKF